MQTHSYRGGGGLKGREGPPCDFRGGLDSHGKKKKACSGDSPPTGEKRERGRICVKCAE